MSHLILAELSTALLSLCNFKIKLLLDLGQVFEDLLHLVKQGR